MNGRRSSNEGQQYGGHPGAVSAQNGPSRWDALAGPGVGGMPGGNNNRWDNRGPGGGRSGGRWDGGQR